ncbi:hypothetical protein H312_00023 [Anncaliia algerae PRA339]|uniref:Uncharacterized protein n=1 Tax=Anncaliia algerae PRA339 TaxID=1288291 RepID=A0A059F583_9MICR|nr:hypothetical protein H312_00023 [Anncaliia algerae PRA339]
MEVTKIDRKTERIVVIFFIFYLLKSIGNGLCINETNYLDTSNKYKLANHKIQIFYIYQFYVLSSAFYYFYHYDIVGSIYFSMFFFIYIIFNLIVDIIRPPFLALKLAYGIFNVILEISQLVFLCYKYLKLRKSLVWCNLNRLGGNINNLKKNIIQSKHKTCCKVFGMIISSGILEIIISFYIHKAFIFYILNIIICLGYFAAFKIFSKHENLPCAFLLLIYNLTLVFIYITIMVIFYSHIIGTFGLTSFYWNVITLFVIISMFYYSFQLCIPIFFFRNRDNLNNEEV